MATDLVHKADFDDYVKVVGAVVLAAFIGFGLGQFTASQSVVAQTNAIADAEAESFSLIVKNQGTIIGQLERNMHVMCKQKWVEGCGSGDFRRSLAPIQLPPSFPKL